MTTDEREAQIRGYALAMEVAREFQDLYNYEGSHDLMDAMDRVAKSRWGWRWERAKEKAQEGQADER